MKDLQKDFEWIKSCLNNKDNKLKHYPMLQKLVHLYTRKHMGKYLALNKNAPFKETKFLLAYQYRNLLDDELSKLLKRFKINHID